MPDWDALSDSIRLVPGNSDVDIDYVPAHGVAIVRSRPRPMEALLGDPLSEVARKERRSLLGISAIAILVGATGLIPQRIESLGVTFTVSTQAALLKVFTGVVGYYTVAFLVYATGDFLRHARSIYRGTEELKIQRQKMAAERLNVRGGLRLEPAATVVSPPVQIDDASWRLSRWVPPAAYVRLVFDFIIPLVVAAGAIWSLIFATPPTPVPSASHPTPVITAPSR